MSLEIDPDWWKTLLDEVYLITDARSVGDGDLTRKEVDLFCSMLPMERTDHILDLCGGQGRHSLELCRRGFSHCTVFDYSHTLLRIGIQNADRENLAVRFVQGDARNIPNPPASYHHVLVLGNSLGYAGNSGADTQILREAHRMLVDGGWLLVDVTDGIAVRRHFSPVAWHEIGDDVVVCRQRELFDKVICAREMVLSKDSGLMRDQNYCMRLYSSGELADLLSNIGFRHIHQPEQITPKNGDGDLGFMNHRLVITAQK